MCTHVSLAALAHSTAGELWLGAPSRAVWLLFIAFPAVLFRARQRLPGRTLRTAPKAGRGLSGRSVLLPGRPSQEGPQALPTAQPPAAAGPKLAGPLARACRSLHPSSAPRPGRSPTRRVDCPYGATGPLPS